MISKTLLMYAKNAADEAEQRLDETRQMPRLRRFITMQAQPILVKDADIYILDDGKTKVIKSWITDKPVANRRLNEKTGRIELIDPTVEDKEDRRLLVPNAILI